MLYVFQVDTGTMLTFDMNSALDSVQKLKETIEAKHKIPLHCQVLLAPTGLCLELQSRVCSYVATAAGTDANPIFLFNKQNFESSSPNESLLLGGDDASCSNAENLKNNLNNCLASNMEPSFQTLALRTSLTKELSEAAKEIHAKCESVVQDQILQIKGWGSVVSNHEGIVELFTKKVKEFQSTYEAEDGFSDAMDMVERLPPLIQRLSSLQLPLNLADEAINLLSWITSQSEENSLAKLAENCSKYVSILDQKEVNSVLNSVSTTLDMARRSDMKEVQGVNDRFKRLQDLLDTSKTILSEQQEHCNSFQINMSRASSLKDPSILPDLCNSHQQQLQVMQKNHSQLEDITRRCFKSKEELIMNLQTRLNWVMFSQGKISEINLRLSVYTESLKKFQIIRRVLTQIFQSEAVYKSSLVELHRRHNFNSKFNALNKELRSKVGKISEIEKEKRTQFMSNQKDHFLVQTLFTFDELVEPKFSDNCEELPEIDVEVLTQLDLVPESDEFDIKIGCEDLINRLQAEIDSLKKENSELKASYSLKTQTLEENLKNATEKIESLEKQMEFLSLENAHSKQELSLAKEENEKCKISYELQLLQVEESCDKKMSTFELELTEKFEKELNEIKEKHRNDFDGLRARVKFIGNTVSNKEVNTREDETVASSLEGSNHFDLFISNLVASLTGKITKNDVRKGDTILAYWSEKYETFIVHCIKEELFFLHHNHNNNKNSSSNIELTDDAIPLFRTEVPHPVAAFTGVVSDKELCVTRRSQNRYGVPQGFSFYRVKVGKILEKFYLNTVL